MKAHELEDKTVYVSNFDPNFMLFCDHLERFQDGENGLTFITMHYRWMKHDSLHYYGDEIFSIDFEWAEEFDYSAVPFVIQELPS